MTGSHDLWSAENRRLQQTFMRRALGGGEGGGWRGGGVVVDPNTSALMAEGHGTDGHPLHHTVMNLLDLVARYEKNLQNRQTCPLLIFLPLLVADPGS